MQKERALLLGRSVSQSFLVGEPLWGVNLCEQSRCRQKKTEELGISACEGPNSQAAMVLHDFAAVDLHYEAIFTFLRKSLVVLC